MAYTYVFEQNRKYTTKKIIGSRMIEVKGYGCVDIPIYED